MAFTTTEEFQAFVSRSVASGRFRSEDEAVQEGLKLLKDREDELEAFRSDLQVGIDQLERRGREMLKARQAEQ
jgi:putative addiction module CopG family antidote